MKKQYMNRKGLSPILVILIIVIFLLIFGGFLTTSLLNSIPFPIWLILLIGLGYLLLRRKR